MKLLQLRCPSCGAKLSVSSQLKSFTCNFCRTTTLLDDEIIRVEHFINNVEKDEIYKKVEAYIKLNKFDAAIKLCEEMIEKYFYDPQTWLYSIEVITQNYAENAIVDYTKVAECLKNYEKLEQDKERKKINVNKIQKYISNLKEKYSDLMSQSLECPFCGDSIKFGQKQCYNCNEELFWPDI